MLWLANGLKYHPIDIIYDQGSTITFQLKLASLQWFLISRPAQYRHLAAFRSPSPIFNLQTFTSSPRGQYCSITVIWNQFPIWITAPTLFQVRKVFTSSKPRIELCHGIALVTLKRLWFRRGIGIRHRGIPLHCRVLFSVSPAVRLRAVVSFSLKRPSLALAPRSLSFILCNFEVKCVDT